jgi:hypothetical protein
MAGYAGELLDQVVAQEKKSERREANLQKRKLENIDNVSKTDRLKKLTRISSGTLASIGKHHICDETAIVLKSHWQVEEQLANNKNVQRQQRIDKQQKKYRATMEKTSNNQLLTVDNMRLLM